ncbi:F-box protein At3g62430-like isoform X1 [Silene latifolia]|uniref:F-box protein At3g62430-like isoform X1 n=1 Tax=Silene latifolia TaxID=37657 RepID=UPI003D77E0DE
MVDVPDCLVMSETLVSLKIISDGNYDIEIPLSVWLPNLKILHLNYVRFVDCDSMQRLFSDCKVLEELTLDRCQCFGSYTGDHVIIFARLLKVLTIEDCTFVKGLFEIDAPNLAYLRYSGNFGIKIVPSWKYSCSLVEAELKFHYCTEISDYSSLECLYDREIFKAAAYKTTKLCLLGRSVEGILKLGDDQEQMPDFHCLSRLHLCNFPYDSWKYVTSLLDKSPQLETVVFEWGLHRCNLDPASPSYEPIFPFSCHAQVIEVRSFCGHKGSLLHLEHLLKNARVLKKLILHKCRFSNLELELQFLQLRKNDLLMLPRASSDCCIELK